MTTTATTPEGIEYTYATHADSVALLRKFVALGGHTATASVTESGDATASCTCGWSYRFWAASSAEADTVAAAHERAAAE